MTYSYIEENLCAVRRQIAEAAERVGRRDPVTLVAVTKSATDEELVALCSLGVSDIGENRPQQLSARAKLLAAAGLRPRLHEIGSLQKNKVNLILPDVYMIQSLDGLALAAQIERAAARLGRSVPVLVEVNSGREPQKGGLLPEEVGDFCASLADFPHLALRGLMTMGPAVPSAEELRPCFALTKALFDRVRADFGIREPVLSMGMSESFSVAVEEGATLVRVGRRLFVKPDEAPSAS